MTLPVPVGAWMVAKKLQYSEEASFGVPAVSPTYHQIGYNSQVQISAPTTVEGLPQPGSEDPLVLLEAGMDRYYVNLKYRPFDTLFAKYGFNAQGGGVGTIDKSLTLAMTILLGGSTETFIQALGSRIDRIVISGRAGGPITVDATIACQDIPLFTNTLPGTFAANPTSIPLMFKDGGPQPILIGTTRYSVNNIRIQADRFLDWIPQPSSEVAQQILPGSRKITGSVGIVWTSSANYTLLRNDVPLALVWTLRTGIAPSGYSSLLLPTCRFTRLESLNFSLTSTIYETYAFEATSCILS